MIDLLIVCEFAYLSLSLSVSVCHKHSNACPFSCSNPAVVVLSCRTKVGIYWRRCNCPYLAGGYWTDTQYPDRIIAINTSRSMLSEFEKAHLYELEKRYNFEYLRPPKEVYDIVIPQQQFFSDKDTKEPRRRIYFNVPFNPDELQLISEVRTELQHHHISQKISDELILKHAYMTKFDKHRIVQRLKDIINHHRNPVITAFNHETLKRLQQGIMYTYGHDKGLKPIVVIRIDRINFEESFELLLNAYYYFMLTIFHYRMVPYHAEKLVFIVDFGTMALTRIPVFSLWEEIRKLGVLYCGITERTIVFNSASLGWIWRLVSSFLNENQRRKLVMIPQGQEERILEYIEPDQLEVKYGGRLPNLTEYWPPRSTRDNQERLERVEEESDYFSVFNDEKYFETQGEGRTKGGCCGNCNCDIY